MARKRVPAGEPPPYATIEVRRPNGAVFEVIPTDTREARAKMNEAWGRITRERGWTPDIRVIRFDGADITNLV